MRTTSVVAAIILAFVAAFSPAAEAMPDLAKIDRSIAREPDYQDQPHYALLVFGPNAQQRAWLVLDGDNVAYIDRNGNGDLTEPGERIDCDVEATLKIKLGKSTAYRAMNVFPLGKIAEAELFFQLWVRNPDFDLTSNQAYQERFREWEEKKWVNGSLYRVAAAGARAQNPLLLTATADEAQISHLNGPLTFDLKWGDQQRLEPWPKETVFDVHIGTRNVQAKNCNHRGFAFSPLTTAEVPADVRPVATFEFRSTAAGGESIVQELTLDRRCCGDTFYARFTLPQEAATESVKVTVSCPTAWDGQGVQPAEFRVPVNRELARFGERTYVMFSDPSVTMKDAVNALRRRGFDVEIDSERISVLENRKPAFEVTLKRGKEVMNTSERLARGTDYAAQLNQCDARFEIGFDDFKRIQSEPTMLADICSALQELTHGYAYNTWIKRSQGQSDQVLPRFFAKSRPQLALR